MDDLPPRCADLNGQQVVRALRSAEAMRTLLEHLARIAAPRQGATKILVPICQMASKLCKWVDGELTVDIGDVDGDRTRIMIAVDIGGGAREALFPKLLLEVPWAEFESAIENAPRLVAPMNYRVKKKSILLAADAQTIASVAPPTFAIAEESWRRSLPPAVRRSLRPTAVPVEMPVIGGELALLARARLAPPKTLAVDESDLADLRAIAMPAPRQSSKPPGKRLSKAPTKRPLPPPKKIVIRKRAEKT